MGTSEFEDKVRGEARFRALEQRLGRIEDLLKLESPAQAPKPPASPQPAVQPAPPLQAAPAAPAEPARAARSENNWLGAVAVICFVLAAGFIIKLSIDSGWLTPVRQIGLAAFFGISLIAAGFALMESDREYSSLLPGAGVIVLYLAVFAAHRLYALIPFESAISMTGLVSGLCIWLYTRIREELYPVTAAVGSYCAPVILGLGATAEFTLYCFLLCSVAFAVISIWVKSRTLTMVSAYLAILMTAVIGFNLHRDGLIANMLALHFMIFACGTYLYTRQRQTPLTEKEAWNFLPVLMVFYAAEYYFVDQLRHGLAPWLSLGFSAVLTGLYLSARKWFSQGSLGSRPMLLAFITLVVFHSFYLELLPRDFRPWLFVVIALALALPGTDTADRKRGGPFFIPGLAILAVLVLEYTAMLFHLMTGSELSWLVVSLAGLGSLWVLIDFKGEALERQGGYGPLLGAAHLLAILGFYRLTTDVSSLAVSASWLFYAVCVIAYAFSRRDEVMAKSAVFVLGFAAGKALLYDAAAAATVVRILCLLLTGAVLYGAGFLLRKISSWKDAGRPAAGELA